MTLKEFWESKERLAINCRTEEQANIFCEEAHKIGEKWRTGISYLEDNFWNKHKDNTCYINDNSYGNINYLPDRIYKFLNFEDIDWGIQTKQQELYQKYGKDNQINIVIEEMSELTKELLKDKRGFDNRANIVEELADVLFTLEYVKMAFSISQEEIDKVLKDKGLK